MVNRFQLIASAFAVVSLSIATAFSVTESATAQRVVTCESQGNQRKICRMDTQGGVRLAKQLSRTSCSGNWGYTRNAVWVRNGCRGQFVATRRPSSRYR